MKDKKLVVDGLLTAYGQIGNGPKILLLHGWGDNHRTFDVLAAALSTKYCLLAPDLPGFGGSQAPQTVWDLDNYAAFIGSFLNKLGAADVAAVVGHSNGGAIAIKGLSRGHFKADRLVLLAASGIRKRQGAKNMGLAAVAKFGKAASAPLSSRLRGRLQRKLYELAGSDGLVAPALKESFKKIVRQDVRLDAGKLHLPALLLYGSNDESTPPSFGVLYKQLIRGSEVEIIQDTGHFLHHDNPEIIATKLKDFLA